MFAKYQLSVHNTPTEEGEAFVTFPGSLSTEVRASGSAESPDTLSLECFAEFEPPLEVLDVFRGLAQDTLPLDAEPYETLSSKVEPGQSLGGHIPSPDILPDSFKSFSAILRTELSSAARTVAELYRWRTDTYPPRSRRTSSKGAHFSIDGQAWFMIPSEGTVRISAAAHVRFTDSRFVDAVQPMLDTQAEEPLGFDLLSEASELSAANPRSALIIAIAALEVGLKAFIGKVVPDARWLAMQAPTPPLVQMLREYLPGLPVPQRLPSDDVRSPPEATLRTIKDANDRRNFVTHAGSTVSYELIDATLEAVSDVLRLLDYYGGETWGKQYMSYGFAVSLGLRERDEQIEQLLKRENGS